MAINEDTDFPRLTPPEEKMPSGSRLLRRAEELTDDQFDYLAAAWAEGALSGEALAELESVIAADDLRRVRAESFRSIRLAHRNDSWSGHRTAIRPSPVLTAFRRNIIPALLAVAAMIVIVISGPAGAKLKTTNSGSLTAEKGPVVAEISASSPIVAVTEVPAVRSGEVAVTEVPAVRSGKVTVTEVPAVRSGKVAVSRASGIREGAAAVAGEPLAKAGAVAVSDPSVAGNRPDPAASAISERAQPLILAWSNAVQSTVAPAINHGMTTVSMKDIAPSQSMQEEKNWMLRSVSFLASAVTGKEKQIDGYAIASGCVSGINTIFGWDMQLEQVSSRGGKPVAVSFSSSLISFTKPVNKTTP